MSDFKRDVAGIGALEDDLRRELYEFVTACSRPVSREQAAHALGVPPHQAKFHLDRLVAIRPEVLERGRAHVREEHGHVHQPDFERWSAGWE